MIDDIQISIHALRVEGDLHLSELPHCKPISIHALRVEGDPGGDHPAADVPISIHALRVEGDLNPIFMCNRKGGISIHALRVEGDVIAQSEPAVPLGISIHALRVEGDRWPSRPATRRQNFYPRPPCGGRRWRPQRPLWLCPFLSTPSVWRATGNIRCPGVQQTISIHALRVEGDELLQLLQLISFEFLSTPSVWRATGSGFSRTRHHRFLSTPSVWRATLEQLL